MKHLHAPPEEPPIMPPPPAAPPLSQPEPPPPDIGDPGLPGQNIPVREPARPPVPMG